MLSKFTLYTILYMSISRHDSLLVIDWWRFFQFVDLFPYTPLQTRLRDSTEAQFVLKLPEMLFRRGFVRMSAS